MSIATFLQSGIKSLSGIYAQAVAGMEKFNQEAQKNYEAIQRFQLIKKFDAALKDLSENGTFYNRVNPHFTYTGNVVENNCSANIRINFSRPRQDNPNEKAYGHIPMSIDGSSWESLYRDMCNFSKKYKETYWNAYSDDPADADKKMRVVVHLLAKYVREAHGHIENKSAYPAKEYN